MGCAGNPCKPNKQVCINLADGKQRWKKYKEVKGAFNKVPVMYKCRPYRTFKGFKCYGLEKVQKGWVKTEEDCLDICEAKKKCMGCLKSGKRVKKTYRTTWHPVYNCDIFVPDTGNIRRSKVFIKEDYILKPYFARRLEELESERRRLGLPMRVL